MLQWGDTSAMGPLWTRLWLYGASGSGKSICAALFPRSTFLLVHNENSEVSLRGMPIRYAKVGVPPAGARADTIVAVRKDVDDYLNALLAAAHQGMLHEFGQTLVIDNMTHLNDLVVTEIASLRLGESSKPGVMEKQKWGLLRNFYMHMRDVLWQLPMHVVFVSHSVVHKDAGGSVTYAGPQLQGAGADLLPSSCDAIGYCEQTLQGQRVVHFSKQINFPARHRYNGVGGGPFPNHELWRHIGPALGHQV